ncbi:MAG: metallophosphoesterase [Candidatus Aenigmarchaeota archaeon]|nr:metallophosphoesterase [Candidatus Aenigmarchaeota archaeon]
MRPEPKFVTNEPAVLFGKTLVIADLHIGVEYELYKSGIRIPKQTEKLLARVKKLIKTTRANRLVLLGDLKHFIPYLSFQEMHEIPNFLEELSHLVKVDIVPGNHDGDLKKFLPTSVEFHETSGFRLDNVYFNHGHSWPNEDIFDSDYLVIGHIHPCIEFRDKLGFRFIEQAWIKLNMDKKRLLRHYKSTDIDRKVKDLKIIIIPAFNRFVGGRPFGAGEGNAPVIRLADARNAEARLLDGTDIGKLAKFGNFGSQKT